VFPRIKELQKLQNLEKSRGRLFKKSRNVLVNSCNECKQAISLPKGVYCGVWREQINPAMCQHCPYFDIEPLEYKLFKRT
jgi:hypothetical protein